MITSVCSLTHEFPQNKANVVDFIELRRPPTTTAAPEPLRPYVPPATSRPADYYSRPVQAPPQTRRPPPMEPRYADYSRPAVSSYRPPASARTSSPPYRADPPYGRPAQTSTSTDRAADCPIDGNYCKLPSCFCSRTGLDVPGGLAVAETPQMVLISFDGAVTDRVINRLKALFDGKFRNPNRCRIRGTLFGTHVHNNYDQTQWLLSHGVELGLSSMSGTNMSTQYERRWYDELTGMRAALEKFSYANRSAVNGVRAPFFEHAGDHQMKTLTHLGFKYDSSVQAEEGPFWPQTLDYRPPWQCRRRCPNLSHQGLWELPLHDFEYGADRFFDLSEMTHRLTTNQQLKDALLANFQRHVENSRAPFQLPLSADFLISLPDAGVVNVLQEFIEEIRKRDYVYIVSMSQAVEWLKRPTRLTKLHSFRPWGCRQDRFATVQPCENPSTCSFMHVREGGPTPHSFRVCGSCPNVYPWINDPVGSGISS